MALLVRVRWAPVRRPGVLSAGGWRLSAAFPGAAGHLPTLFPQLVPGAAASHRLLIRGGSGAVDGGGGGERKANQRQQLKRVFKEYGGAAVTFHVAISLTSLGIFYLLVSGGLDVPSLLLRVGFSESVVQSKLAAGTSTFVLAYAIHKVFAPVRMGITVVSVPFLVRYLRRVGIFKPPSPPC